MIFKDQALPVVVSLLVDNGERLVRRWSRGLLCDTPGTRSLAGYARRILASSATRIGSQLTDWDREPPRGCRSPFSVRLRIPPTSSSGAWSSMLSSARSAAFFPQGVPQQLQMVPCGRLPIACVRGCVKRFLQTLCRVWPIEGESGHSAGGEVGDQIR